MPNTAAVANKDSIDRRTNEDALKNSHIIFIATACRCTEVGNHAFHNVSMQPNRDTGAGWAGTRFGPDAPLQVPEAAGRTKSQADAPVASKCCSESFHTACAEAADEPQMVCSSEAYARAAADGAAVAQAPLVVEIAIRISAVLSSSLDVMVGAYRK